MVTIIYKENGDANLVRWRNTSLVSINDPALMTGKPAALMHAVESFVALGANPITDAAAIQASEKLSQAINIPTSLKDPDVKEDFETKG